MKLRVEPEQNDVYLIPQYKVGYHVLNQVSLDVIGSESDAVERQDALNHAFDEALYLRP